MEKIDVECWQWISGDQLENLDDWWNIYLNSFPSTERDKREDLIQAVKDKFAIAGVYVQDKKIVAILVFCKMQTLPFIFLNYIAIAKSMRNQGLGKKLFTSFVNQLKIVAPNYFTIVWELEDPEQATDINERKQRERRIAFYQSLGGKFLPHPFIQPPLDEVNYIKMRLMYYPLILTINILEVEQIIARSIYLEKYQIVNKISREIIENLCKENNF